MAIVCIKIGENELPTYRKFDRLSRHMDIIEVLPRKRDKEGKPVNRTIGFRGDREYLGLNVDMSHLDDLAFEEFRSKLKEAWLGDISSGVDEEGNPEFEIQAKQLWYIDLGKIHIIGISAETKTKITVQANLQRDKAKKHLLNMNSINKFDKVIPFNLFAQIAVNKKTGQTLAEELNG